MNIIETYQEKVKELDKEAESLRPERKELAIQTGILTLLQFLALIAQLVTGNEWLFIVILILTGLNLWWFHRLNKVQTRIMELLIESASLHLALNLALHIAKAALMPKAEEAEK